MKIIFKNYHCTNKAQQKNSGFILFNICSISSQAKFVKIIICGLLRKRVSRPKIAINGPCCNSSRVSRSSAVTSVAPVTAAARTADAAIRQLPRCVVEKETSRKNVKRKILERIQEKSMWIGTTMSVAPRPPRRGRRNWSQDAYGMHEPAYPSR
jgi:hypothetical protein